VSGFLGGGGGGAVACGREEGSARSTMGERSRGDAYYEEEGAREMVGCGGKERVERHWRHSHVGPPSHRRIDWTVQEADDGKRGIPPNR
jgi:hypothetical protein